jgi:hypothetical protein
MAETKQKSSGKKLSKEVKKKQKTLVWAAIVVTGLNFLLVLAFFIYLYFWVKAR